MKNTENTTPAGRILGRALFVGLALTLILMLAGALVVYLDKISADAILPLALAALAAGGLTAALLAAFGASRSKFLWGLAGGGSLLLCLVALSLLWFGQPVELQRVLLVCGVTMAAACVGSLVGAGIQKPKHRRKNSGRKSS